MTRAGGLVSLVLLSAVMVLGILNSLRWSDERWPRFVLQALHRNLSLLAIAFLILHILTAELDTFAPVGWASVVVPFASPYRPVWLGLGTVAFDLVIALIATSLVRARMSYRAWRAVHWLSYLCWPVAMVHGLGTGTDTRDGLVQAIYAACALAVAAALVWRLAAGWRDRPLERLLAALGTTLVTIVVLAWMSAGPLRSGWARVAGTPQQLLSSANAASATPSTAAPASGSQGSAGVPAPSTSSPSAQPSSFQAGLRGEVSQTGPDEQGYLSITIDATLVNGPSGRLSVHLVGPPAGDGVEAQQTEVSYGPASNPRMYQGQLTSLEGEQLSATVSDAQGQSLSLAIQLRIDAAAGTVSGTVQGSPSSSGGEGGGGE